jgi:hypothetical protein
MRAIYEILVYVMRVKVTVDFLTCICLRQSVEKKTSRNIVTSSHPVLIRV